MSKRVVILSAVVTALVPALAVVLGPESLSTNAVAASASPTVGQQQLSGMPLAFTKNDGQWDERVLYRTSAGGATVWFCRDGIYYQFIHRVPSETGQDALKRLRADRDPLVRVAKAELYRDGGRSCGI